MSAPRYPQGDENQSGAGGCFTVLLFVMILGALAFGTACYHWNLPPQAVWPKLVAMVQNQVSPPQPGMPIPVATQPSKVAESPVKAPSSATTDHAQENHNFAPVLLAPGAKSPLVTNFTPTVREVRDANSGLLHPAILLTKAQLDTMQRHVRNGDQPWAIAFEKFSAISRCSTNPRIMHQPAWTQILHGKPGNFITFRMAMDSSTALDQVLMWYVTGNETYRLNALKIIRDYYSITTVQPHWDSQIRWGVASYKMCCAAEILRQSDGNTDASRWTEDDTARFGGLMKMGEELVAGTGYWMNQHGFSTMGEMGTAIFLDDRKLYEEAVERTTVNSRGAQGNRNGSIEWQMRLVTENFLTKEQVKPQVQLVEMVRDEAHAWINVAALSTCCQTIDNQGTKVDPVKGTVSTGADAVDAFDFLDNRLLAGTDYITRFSLGEPVTWIPLDMGDSIKGTPRGFFDLGILYNHYKYTEKWSASDPRFRAVATAYESIIPEGESTDFPCESTLLFTPDDGLIKPSDSR